MAAVSELAYYDIGLEPWEIPKDTETSQDSQRVIYEGHNPVNSRGEQLIQVKTNTVPWGISESSLELSPGVSASSKHSESVDKRIAMENMTKYSGGGGANQKNFVRELRATYGRMKNSSKEHELEGFGEMEFVKQLGPCLIGESKDVLSAFIDVWDHEKKTTRISEQPETQKNAELNGGSTSGTVRRGRDCGRIQVSRFNPLSRSATNLGILSGSSRRLHHDSNLLQQRIWIYCQSSNWRKTIRQSVCSHDLI